MLKKFETFLEEKTPKYISIYYDKETQSRLRGWCEKNGFDLTMDYYENKIEAMEFSFHTTIIFTSTAHELDDIQRMIDPITVYAEDFQYLGKNKNIPVLNVDSESIQTLRKAYDYLGMKSSWPNFHPHISLSYNRDKRVDFKNLKIPAFPLRANEIVIKDAKS